MSRLAGDTTQRMCEAFTIEMNDATKEAHRASMGDVLSAIGASAPTVRAPWWRARVPALVAAVLVVLPVGTAIASESAVPGDLLYPVKRFVEPVRSVVDSDVVAQHRVDELAHLMDIPTQAERLTDAVEDARDAVRDLPIDHRLRTDFDRLTDRATDAAQVTVPSSEEEDSDHPVTDTNTDRPAEEEPVDRPHETDTLVDPPPDDAPADTHQRHDRSDPHTDEAPPVRDAPPRDG